MTDYRHDIRTTRSSELSSSVTLSERVQVAVGTAPINLLDNPKSAVNVPVFISNKNDMKNKLGICGNYKYTLMQTILACQKVGTAPIIMINVLNPDNPEHITAVSGQSYELKDGSVTIDKEGILLDTMVVTSESQQGVRDTDYIVAFNDNGYPVLAVTSTGAFKDKQSLTIAYTKLKPEGVKASDVAGGISQAGKRSGIELIDEVYSRFGYIPDILSAPVFSSDPVVAAALEAKAELAGDLTNAVAVIDLDCQTNKKVEDAVKSKDAAGCFSRWSVACWPKVIMGGEIIGASAAVAALLQSVTTKNAGIPTSPDNKSIPIDGIVLDNGEEIYLTQKQINNYLNANGIVSFNYIGGWKCWGNNTAAYPANTEPNNRFIKCVMMSNYLENRFKTEYLSTIGTDGSTKVIDSIVSNYNTDLNALVPDYLAGAEVIFNKDENPASQIMEGKFVFHTRYADWTPVEAMDNKFTWDSKILSDAFGEEE